MNDRATHRRPLAPADRQWLAMLLVLERVVTQPGAWPAAPERHTEAVQPHVQALLDEALAEAGPDDFLQATERGLGAYRTLLRQQQSYLVNLDVYAGVDLGEATFADPDADNLEEPRWMDLRVPVAEFKGIDPYRVVFVSLLADGSFFANKDWMEELAPHAPFFADLEDIVQAQVTMEELGYETEDGLWISGEAVIEDIIEQGSETNRLRLERDDERQVGLFEDNGAEEDDDGWDEVAPGVWAERYDAPAAVDAYLTGPRYVETFWLDDYW